jgi:hypothetical protein
MYNYAGLKLLDKYQYSSNNMKRKINDIEVFNIFTNLDKAIEDSKFGKRNIYVKGFFNVINQSNKKTSNRDLANFNVNIHWLEIQNDSLKTSINKLVTDIENTFNILKLSLNENEKILKELNESEKRIQNIFEKRKNDLVSLNNQLDYFSKMISDAEIKDIEAKKEISNIAMINLRNTGVQETDISEKDCFENFIKYKLKNKSKLNKIYEEGRIDYKLLKEIKKELRDELKSTFMYLLNENIVLNKYDDKHYLNDLIKMREDKSNLNENGINLCFSGVSEYHNIGLKRNNELVTLFDAEDVIDIFKDEFKVILKTKYNKNPNIVKFFIEKEEEFSVFNENLDCDEMKLIDLLISKYLENKNILDNNNFKFFEEFNESIEKTKKLNINDNLIPYGSTIDISKVCEFFEDKTKKIIHDHNVKNFAKSILSNKYIHLLSDDNIKIIKEIYDLNLKKDTFQKYIGKKIAKYKSPEEFNEGLNSFLKSFNSFTKEAIINKANDHGAEIIDIGDYTNDLLVLKINNFEQSKFLGSQSWCISSTESYFKSYANDNEQYFIYNFTFPQTSEESMVGLTLSNGDFNAGFYKDDSEVDPESSEIQEYIEMINSAVDNNLKNIIDEKSKNKNNIF